MSEQPLQKKTPEEETSLPTVLEPRTESEIAEEKIRKQFNDLQQYKIEFGE